MAILGLDTPTKKGIFVGYMGLWCALRMLIYGSKQKVEYDQTTLLVVVCFMKLLIAGAMYLQQDGGFSLMFQQWKENRVVFLKYFLPAASYVLYDNLTFVNLQLSDPVTYVILMQMRLAATGLAWQGLFGKSLNSNQWISIALLTIACLCQKGYPLLVGEHDSSKPSATVMSLLLIGFQIVCGVFSSVFNEFLLKEKGSAGVNLQNMFMYTHSIVCNVVWLAVCPQGMCKKDLWAATTGGEMSRMMHPLVLPIIGILASIGIITSLFIKYLDSVRKTIASAIEIFVDALLALALFGIPIGLETVLAISCASAGVIMYSRPVDTKKDEDKPPAPSGGSNGGTPSQSDLENPDTHSNSFGHDSGKRKLVGLQ